MDYDSEPVELRDTSNGRARSPSPDPLEETVGAAEVQQMLTTEEGVRRLMMENRRLAKQLHDLEEREAGTVAQHTRECRQLRSEIESAVLDRAHLQRRIDELNDRSEQADEVNERSRRQEETATLARRLASESEALRAAMDDIEASRKELKQLRKEAQRSKEDASYARNEATKLKSELEELRTEHDHEQNDAKVQLQALRSGKDRIQRDLDHAQERVMQLEAQARQRASGGSGGGAPVVPALAFGGGAMAGHEGQEVNTGRGPSNNSFGMTLGNTDDGTPRAAPRRARNRRTGSDGDSVDPTPRNALRPGHTPRDLGESSDLERSPLVHNTGKAGVAKSSCPCVIA